MKTKTYSTKVVLFSAVGDTPKTKRGKSYCDELFRGSIECESPEDARRQVSELLRTTPHAYKGFYRVDGWPNQNTRDGSLNRFSKV